MKATTDYLAIDLGAESGRGVLGKFDGERVALEDVHRFPNIPVRLVNTLHWDLPRLFDDVKTAIRKALAEGSRLDAVGVDAWGVDFGLVGRGDTLLGNPVHYRDNRTRGVMERAFARMPKTQIYEITGLQFMPINTLYQLISLAEAKSPLLEVAESFLMIPDLFHWLLTGRRVGERTNASTTQVFNPVARGWSDAILAGFGIPRAIFPEIVEPGAELGPLHPAVAEELGVAPVPIVAPATHDTASAVASVPALGSSGSEKPDWCYISSGTWSLLGVEVARPIITPQTAAVNLTNEGGVDGTTRLLKNIMGLWLVQECRRQWSREGKEFSYDDLMNAAAAAPPFAAVVDPDDPSFLAPGNMPARLADYCKRTGQATPGGMGAVVRMCLEGLAFKYRLTIERIEAILGCPIKRIHVVGGGSKNPLLCRLTADACDRPVHAGPVEATAAGNILLQARARGKVAGLAELRQIVAASFPVVIYEPQSPRAWDDAYPRFRALGG